MHSPLLLPSHRMDTALEAGNPVALCPHRNTTQVCDINTVTIENTASKRSVKADSSRPAVCSPGMPKEKSEVAAGYQLILETVSAVIRPDRHFSEEEKVAKIKADMVCVGSCEEHGKIFMRGTPQNPDPKDGLSAQTEFSTGGLAIYTPAKFWGPADDPRADFNLATFFLQPPESIKSMELVFERCGLRVSGEPVASVRGLVRVYRDEKFELSILLPPWKEHTFKLREPAAEGGYKETQSVASVPRGDAKKPETFGEKAKELLREDATKTETFGKKGELKSTTYSKGWLFKDERTVDWETLNAKVERKIELTISLKRNGVELDTGNSITAIVQNLRKTAEEFCEALLDIEAWLPKVGLSYSATVSFCEGEIIGVWGVREQPAWDTDSAKWVSGYGELKLKLVLLKLSASIQFGIEAASPAVLAWWGAREWELIALVKGTLSGEVALEASIPLWGAAKEEHNRKELGEASGSIKGDLLAHGRVSAMGIVFEVKGGLEMGFDAKGSVVHPLAIKVDVTRQACVLYCQWTAPAKQRNSPRWEHVIWKDKDIVKDKFVFDSAKVKVAEAH